MEGYSFHKAPGAEGGSSLKRILIVLVVLIVLGGIIFAASTFLLGNDTAQKLASAPTPTEFLLPSDTPAVSASGSATPSVSSTKKGITPTLTPSPTPAKSTTIIDKTTGLDRSKLTINVQNGSGTPGVAGKIATYLKGLGYVIGTTGNADTFDYVGVSISVTALSSKYLKLLETDLGKQYKVGSTSATLSSSTADAVVIIGK